MSDKPYIIDFKEEDKTTSLKELVAKYIRFWPWFLASCVLFLFGGYLYAKYAPKTYETISKIKILDDAKEPRIINNDRVSSNTNIRISLENHIQVIKSYKLLSEVVDEQKLDVLISRQNDFLYSPVVNAPFTIHKTLGDDEISEPITYKIALGSVGFEVTGTNNKNYLVAYESWETNNQGLPFGISLNNVEHVNNYRGNSYKVVIMSKRFATNSLSEKLKITSSEKQSDVLILALKGENRDKTERVLNSIINKLAAYNIEENRSTSQMILNQIDQRFQELSGELDSIEYGKEDYKQLKNLSNIETDAGVSLSKKTSNEAEVLRLGNQLASIEILKKSMNNGEEYGLLASDIGITNQTLGSMVANYNELARERQKLILSVGKDHPALKNLLERLDYAKDNILETVRVYESQVSSSLKAYNTEKYLAESAFSQLPEKERILRSIDRNQNIKEDLYMLLLRKREETAIDYATATSSISVIDYAVSGIKPIWPKKLIVYPLSLLLGFLFPFGILYLKYSMDEKVNGRTDIEKVNPEIPILIEIPLFEQNDLEDFKEGTILAESFRILGTNTDYLIPKKNNGKVVYVTSSVKAEGKTLTALNLSLAYSSMGKKVLLVGADLRNPQLHTYTNLDRNSPGLSDYLENSLFDFEDGLQKEFEKDKNYHIYLSGFIPENTPSLLFGNRYGQFLDEAKSRYDYIIVDTAPTLLVTDTLLISKYADITLFVVRSGFTEKNLLEYSKELYQGKKLKNMVYVVNAVGKFNNYKYNYGYRYGYEFEEKNNLKIPLVSVIKKLSTTISKNNFSNKSKSS